MKSIVTKPLLIGSFSFFLGLSFGQDSIPLPDYCPTLAKSPKQEEIIYDYVDEPAEFPGGNKALLQFIQDHLKYPESALKNGIEGKCYVKLLISDKGIVKEAKLLKGIPDCPECKKEALRIMHIMPVWKPGKVNGKPVSSYYRLPVSFKLN
jgi:protein TonB